MPGNLIEFAIEATNRTAGGIGAAKGDIRELESAAQGASGHMRGLGQAMDEAESHAGRLHGALASIAQVAGGMALGGGLMELPGKLFGLVQAAADDEAATLRVQQALRNLGGDVETHTRQVNDAIASGQKLAYSDDEIRDSFVKLATATGDTDEALRRQKAAMDLARGAHIDLGEASKLLGKLTDENLQVFKRMGITLPDVASSADVLAAVQAKFGGQADAYAKSTAGQFAQAKIAFSEAGESIGYIILPALTKLAQGAAVVLSKVQEFTGWLSEKLGPVIGEVAGWLGDRLQPVIEAIGDGFQFIGDVIGVVVRHWDDITAAVRTFVDYINQQFPEIGQMFAAFSDTMSALGQLITRTVVPAFVKGVQLIHDNWDDISRVIAGPIQIARAIIEGELSTIRDMFKLTFTIIADVFRIFGDLFRGDWDKLGKDLHKIADDFTSGIRRIIMDKVKEWEGIFSGAWTTIRTVANTAWGQFGKVISDKLNDIVGWMRTFPQRAIDALGNLSSFLLKKGSDLLQGLLDGINAVWKDVKAFFEKLPGNASSAVGDAAKTLYTKGLDILHGFTDGVNDQWHNLEQFFKDMPKHIVNAIGDVSHTLWQKGKDLIGGFASGVSDTIKGLGKLGDWISGQLGIAPVPVEAAPAPPQPNVAAPTGPNAPDMTVTSPNVTVNAPQGFQFPVSGSIMNPYGTPFQGGTTEQGTDINANVGTPAVAGLPGRVSNIFTPSQEDLNYGGGRWVTIDFGNGLSEVIGHLDDVVVQLGQEVQQGQVIGHTGGESAPGYDPTQSPWSPGPHTEVQFWVNGRNIDPETVRGLTPAQIAAQFGLAAPTVDPNLAPGVPNVEADLAPHVPQRTIEDIAADAAASAASAAAAANSAADSAAAVAAVVAPNNNIALPDEGAPVRPESNQPFFFPAQGPITQGFGENGEKGTDIGVPTGTPLVAGFGGRITDIRRPTATEAAQGLGSWVTIDLGDGLQEVIGHLDSVAVALNQVVQQGDVIGASGGELAPGVSDSPYSTGPHTEVRFIQNGQLVDPTTVQGLTRGQILGNRTAPAPRGRVSGTDIKSRTLAEIANFFQDWGQGQGLGQSDIDALIQSMATSSEYESGLGTSPFASADTAQGIPGPQQGLGPFQMTGARRLAMEDAHLNPMSASDTLQYLAQHEPGLFADILHRYRNYLGQFPGDTVGARFVGAEIGFEMGGTYTPGFKQEVYNRGGVYPGDNPNVESQWSDAFNLVNSILGAFGLPQYAGHAAGGIGPSISRWRQGAGSRMRWLGRPKPKRVGDQLVDPWGPNVNFNDPERQNITFTDPNDPGTIDPNAPPPYQISDASDYQPIPGGPDGSSLSGSQDDLPGEFLLSISIALEQQYPGWELLGIAAFDLSVQDPSGVQWWIPFHADESNGTVILGEPTHGLGSTSPGSGRGNYAGSRRNAGRRPAPTLPGGAARHAVTAVAQKVPASRAFQMPGETGTWNNGMFTPSLPGTQQQTGKGIPYQDKGQTTGDVTQWIAGVTQLLNRIDVNEQNTLTALNHIKDNTGNLYDVLSHIWKLFGGEGVNVHVVSGGGVTPHNADSSLRNLNNRLIGIGQNPLTSGRSV